MPDFSRFHNICMFCNGAPGDCQCGKGPTGNWIVNGHDSDRANDV